MGKGGVVSCHPLLGKRDTASYYLLHRIFSRELFRLGSVPSWEGVGGPAGVVICTCARIKWVPVPASRFTTQDGTTIDMGRMAPAAVRLLVKKATMAEAKNRAADPLGIPALRGNMAIEQACGLMRSVDLNAKQRTTLASVLSNGIWPCGRMFQLGKTPSPFCQRCALEGNTLFHWAWKISQGKCKPSAANKMIGVDIQWDHGDLVKSKAGALIMVKGFGLALPPRSTNPPSITSNHISGPRTDVIRQLTRPVMRAAPGRLQTFNYEPDSGRLEVSASGASDGVLVLFYPVTKHGQPITERSDGLEDLRWVEGPGGDGYLIGTVTREDWLLVMSL